MKKVIVVDDLCCQRCADQMAVKLALVDGVHKAKANYKQGKIFIEVEPRVEDNSLTAVFEGTGMTVKAIEIRKGIFG